MDQIIPWKEMTEAIEPYYPNPKGAGRRPVGLERMLRIHFLQHWFELSDPGVEEILYDSRAMRSFVGQITESPLVLLTLFTVTRNLPSVGYGMQDRFTLGERIVNK